MILIISRVIKIKRENKAIAIASIECDYSRIFIGVAWFLVSVINFKMYSDYRTVNTNRSYYFYVGMVQVLAGILYVITSFDKTIICEDRIYFKNRYCKWESIESYVWIELKRKQSRKEYLEYYCLEIEVDRPIIKKLFKSEKCIVIKMKISVYDKEKVEELLEGEWEEIK